MPNKVSECSICGNEKMYQDCWNCDDGFVDHDCGEDCGCCLDPEPNAECDICEGEGGYLVCPFAESHVKAEKTS